MSKAKKSGSAIFMYCVIAITVIISTVCFSLYYGNIYKNKIILWTGITAFTIMYHFWVRIIMGNVSKLFKNHINYKQWWFKEKKFEKRLYKFLQVKKWKGKALTYNPELFSVKDNSLEDIANTMIKAELDHWINEAISLSTLLFTIPWGEFWIFLITAIIAMIFDSQFIIIQRYNRPRIVNIMNRYFHLGQNKNGDDMKISFIKYEKEHKYQIPKIVGMNVEEITEPEQVDNKIKELKDKEYTTIVISNELASFSENITNKYKYDNSINIIILP